MQTYSLFELNEHIRRVIALNFEEAVWIRCEIAQINQSRGHFYLDIIEKEKEGHLTIAQSSAILWARKYQSLRRKHKSILHNILQNGVAVLLKVHISFDERYGLKLTIEDIDPSYTLGQMELKKQEILAALLQKGLIHLNRQIRLALVPQRIAVISSETAAGLQDYLEHIAINPYGYQFENHLFAAAMQGNNVEKEVGNQLKKIARLKENYDAVIIIRGGGAKLDLAAFDNFELGQLVAQFPLPVLVGIGHEVDETVLDKVAHTSLKTPTAVADFLINRLMQFETTILKYQSTILNTASYIIQNEKGLLTYQKKMLEIQAKNKLKEANFTIEQLQNRLPILATNNVATEKRSLAQLEKIYHLLTPETALKRGFSIVTKNGKVVVDAAQVKPGDIIETQLAKGNIKSIIQ